MRDNINYWLELAADDIKTAKWLFEGGRLLHCGYFCHQSIEKAFKAAVADKTAEIPPKIHDLPRLANLAEIWIYLSNQQREVIKKLEPLQIEARYPEYKDKINKTLTNEYCLDFIKGAEELLCWIKRRLEK